MVDKPTLHLDSNEITDPPRKESELDQAELRARRALGLIGTAPEGAAHRGIAQITRAQLAERVGGDRQHRQFAQKGEVSVVMIPRSSSDSPSAFHDASRLADAEAALEAERLARQRAEKALDEAQATIHELQTRIGHADLARDEAAEETFHLRSDKQKLVEALATERQD